MKELEMSPKPVERNKEYFPLPLVGEVLDNGFSFMLTHPFIFTDGEEKYEAPAFFVTDFNSTPRGLWNYLPPWEYPYAGVIHDLLYRFNGVSRLKADGVHRRILALSGCRPTKSTTAYLALRAFGWVKWNEYRASDPNTLTKP